MNSEILTTFVSARRRNDRHCTYAQYTAVANELGRLTPEQTGKPPLKIALLRNFTIEPLIPVLAGELYFAGFHPLFHIGDFDAIEAEVLNPTSTLYAFEPDFIVLALWLEALSPALTTKFLSSPPETTSDEIVRVRRHVHDLSAALRRSTRAPILLNNFPLPPAPTLGILDNQSTSYQTHAILELNASLCGDARAMSDVLIVDIMRLFAFHGYAHAVDERHWQMARAPLSHSVLLPLGRECVTFIRALRGKAKKCLVLDCDDTLWGGIIGEDGISGIKLGPTYPGSCFVALQEELLNLHDRGVILALCSKNNEADVLEVLREHPDMLLRERHFATWQINWDDKVTNLRRIADELNIGLDSLVFVDDSDFEATFVREQLPEVAVLKLPDKAFASYRAELSRSGLFDSLTYTEEDRRKNAMYGENRTRKQLEVGASSLDDYLATLDIEVEIREPTEIDIPRVSQMTQKTNQFNLTTRRYSTGDIRAFLESAEADVVALKVRDRVSDLGLVGMAIVTYDGAVASIDTLLMSCRALGRGVEDALLSVIANNAQEHRGSSRIVGTYLETAKNAMVKEFYAARAFTLLEAAPARTTWELSLNPGATIEPPSWITLKQGEFFRGRR